ncbi:MAG: hypothetical protein JWN37_207 [Candidatus Nomurabacteria bacterium]|nr:hypothetical protein [Candidatus Nomurabacteria bacterium]
MINAQSDYKAARADVSGGIDMYKVHHSHKTRSSDSSVSDEICTMCGARDHVPGNMGMLAYPCPGQKK